MATQPLEEANLAGLVFFHALGGTQNFTVPILIDHDCHKNGHIFKLSALVPMKMDPIHMDMWMPSTL